METLVVIAVILGGGWYVYRRYFSKPALEQAFIEMLQTKIRRGKITEEQAVEELEEWRRRNGM